MKYLKLLEEYASDRAKKRRFDIFNSSGSISKKNKYE